MTVDLAALDAAAAAVLERARDDTSRDQLLAALDAHATGDNVERDRLLAELGCTDNQDAVVEVIAAGIRAEVGTPNRATRRAAARLTKRRRASR